MEYTVLKGNTPVALANQVEFYMSNGWIPQGGVSAWGGPVSGGALFQAMVRNR